MKLHLLALLCLAGTPSSLIASTATGPIVEDATLAKMGEKSALVMTFQHTANVDKQMTELVTGLFVSNLRRLNRGDVFTNADIQAILGVEQQKQLTGCSDDGCMAELGGALGAGTMISGTLSRLSTNLLLTVRLVDTTEGKLLNQLSETLPKDVDQLPFELKKLSYRLMGFKAPRLPTVSWYRSTWGMALIGGVVIGAAAGTYMLSQPPRIPESGLGQVVLRGN